LALVVELYDTGHLFQGVPGFISLVKTQANPLGGCVVDDDAWLSSVLVEWF
jgi:hypothetical protein